MMNDLITIDGSSGEGGGQILRSSVALAAVLGRPVRVTRIRAGRPKPGLRKQHLLALEAAAAVCGGQVEGLELGSSAITFTPGVITGGEWSFAIGSAGSTCLVLQTLLPMLLHAPQPSTVRVSGGTHADFAPPYEFLATSWLPQLRAMGIDCDIELERHGFAPAGGGALVLRCQPWVNPHPFQLQERGRPGQRWGRVLLAHLPGHVGRRAAEALKHALRWSPGDIRIEAVEADGPGCCVLAGQAFDHVQTIASAVGRLRLPAEEVAQVCARQLRHYLAQSAPVDAYLADQLLLPLALGAGGSFRAAGWSLHSQTNAEVLQAFLGPVVEQQVDEQGHLISVRGRARPCAFAVLSDQCT